jgi:hypothetical protein
MYGYAAPPMVTPELLVTPPPLLSATPQPAFPVVPGGIPVNAMQIPMPPKLTEGLPDVQTIARQKAGYATALDKQLKEAMETVTKETQIEKEMVAFAAKKNVALYEMQVDEKLAEQLAAVDEQSTFAQLELKKALHERNLQLNNQASALVMDYRSKVLQEESRQKQAAFNQQFLANEQTLAQQLGVEQAKANGYNAYGYAANPLVVPSPAVPTLGDFWPGVVPMVAPQTYPFTAVPNPGVVYANPGAAIIV